MAIPQQQATFASHPSTQMTGEELPVIEQLASGYDEMAQRVNKLTDELSELTQQRHIENAEKERVSQRMETLLKLLPAGVVVLDNRGRVTHCNPVAIDFLGEPLEGQQWRDIITRSFAPKLDDGHEISLHDGRLISLATRSFENEGGQIILMTDMTETRRLQTHVSRHKRLTEMGRMMSSLAHQIRTPLSAAMLYAGHLCESDLSAEQSQKFSGKILSRLMHLEQQVKDMLIFVKGDVKLTDRVELATLIDDLEMAMEMPMEKYAASCQWHIDCDEQQLLLINKEALIGALMNLINNALQASQKDVELNININLCEEFLAIEVIDNGPGLSEQEMALLEEPFYTTKQQGTGLGLSIVKAVAEAHHGHFSLSSVLGEGCCARVCLPLLS